MAKSRKRSEPGTSTSNSPAAQATQDPPASTSSPQSTQGTPESSASSFSQKRRDAADDQRERVAQRAYELYLSRGGAHGSDWEDWLAAEKELVTNRGNEEPE